MDIPHPAERKKTGHRQVKQDIDIKTPDEISQIKNGCERIKNACLDVGEKRRAEHAVGIPERNVAASHLRHSVLPHGIIKTGYIMTYKSHAIEHYAVKKQQLG